MTSCTFPAHLLNRLASLHHATDSDAGALAHISLRLQGDAMHVAATNGRLLAVIQSAVDDLDGEDLTVVLDCAAFTAACTILSRGDRASVVRYIIDVETNEARLTRGVSTAVVRCHGLEYPSYQGALERFTGQQLVPAIASFDPKLVAAASKIAGRGATLMWWSPCDDPAVASIWDASPGQLVTVTTVSQLTSRPGLWSDGTLLLLLMPITRSTAGAPDLTPFLALTPELAQA